MKKPNSTIKVILTAPHTDAGTFYPVGASLEVSPQDAEWLLKNGVIQSIPTDSKEENP